MLPLYLFKLPLVKSISNISNMKSVTNKDRLINCLLFIHHEHGQYEPSKRTAVAVAVTSR
jgi:hypothetical protein